MTQPPFPGNDFFDQIDSVARNLTGNAYRLKRDDPTAPQKFTEFIAQSEQEFNATQPQAAPQSFRDFEQGGFVPPEVAEARLQDPDWTASQAQAPFVDPDMDPNAFRNVMFGLNPIGGSAINLLTPREGGGNRVFTPQVPEGFFGSEENLGRLFPVTEAAREITSPFDVLTSAALAGLGPAASAALQGTNRAGRVAAKFVDPITRGGLGRRLAAETGVNLGATFGALEAPKLLPEDAPMGAKIAASLAGGLAGGVGSIGAINAPRIGGAALRKADEAAEAMGRTGVGNVLDPVPPQTVAGRAAGGVAGQRGFKVTDEAARPFPEEAVRFTVSNEGSTAQAIILLPDENGKVIGSIVDFETSPELRRQGFGEALVRDTTEELRRRGATSFEVYAEKTGFGPELFGKLGFTESAYSPRGTREFILDLTRTADEPTTPARQADAAPATPTLTELSNEVNKLSTELDAAKKAASDWGLGESAPKGATQAQRRALEQRNADEVDRLDKIVEDATTRLDAAETRFFEAKDLARANFEGAIPDAAAARAAVPEGAAPAVTDPLAAARQADVAADLPVTDPATGRVLSIAEQDEIARQRGLAPKAAPARTVDEISREIDDVTSELDELNIQIQERGLEPKIYRPPELSGVTDETILNFVEARRAAGETIDPYDRDWWRNLDVEPEEIASIRGGHYGTSRSQTRQGQPRNITALRDRRAFLKKDLKALRQELDSVAPDVTPEQQAIIDEPFLEEPPEASILRPKDTSSRPSILTESGKYRVFEVTDPEAALRQKETGATLEHPRNFDIRDSETGEPLLRIDTQQMPVGAAGARNTVEVSIRGMDLNGKPLPYTDQGFMNEFSQTELTEIAQQIFKVTDADAIVGFRLRRGGRPVELRRTDVGTGRPAGDLDEVAEEVASVQRVAPTDPLAVARAAELDEARRVSAAGGRLTPEQQAIIDATPVRADLPSDVTGGKPPTARIDETVPAVIDPDSGFRELRPIQENLDVAFNETMNAKLGRIIQSTQIGRILTGFNPMLGANNEGKRAIIGFAHSLEEGTLEADRLIARIDEIGSREGLFGDIDDSGLFMGGEFKGLSLNEVREKAKLPAFRARMTPDQQEYINVLGELDEAASAFMRKHGQDIGFTQDEDILFASRRIKGKWQFENDSFYGAYDANGELITTRIDPDRPRVLGTQSRAQQARSVRTAAELREQKFVLMPYDEVVKLRIRQSYRIAAEDNLVKWVKENYAFEKSPTKKNYIEAQKRLFDGQVATTAEGEQFLDDLVGRGGALENFSKAMPANKATKTFGLINNFGRTFVLAGDASIFTIQLLAVIFEDFLPLSARGGLRHIRPKVPGRMTVPTVKQFATSFARGMLSPENARKANARTIVEASEEGLLDEAKHIIMLSGDNPSEFTESVGTLRNVNVYLRRKGGTRKVAGKVATIYTRPLEAFQEAFISAMNTAGLQLWRALRPLTKNADGTVNPQKLADVEDFINNTRGLTSSARMGVSGQRRWIEGNSMLAARYRRATAALMTSVISGGARGDLARNQLAALITGMTLTMAAFTVARGEQEGKSKKQVNYELKERLIPGNGTYMMADEMGQKVGFGSKFISDLNFITKIFTQPSSMWDASIENNVWIRWLRSQFSFALGEPIDLLLGRDVVGNVTRPGDPFLIKGDAPSTREGVLGLTKSLGSLGIPVWAQSVAFEGGDIKQRQLRGGFEFVGSRAYEQGRSSVLTKASFDKFGKPLEDLNQLERFELQNDPQLAPVLEEFDNTRASTGDKFASYRVQRLEDERVAYNRKSADLETMIIALSKGGPDGTKGKDGGRDNPDAWSVLNTFADNIGEVKGTLATKLERTRKLLKLEGYVGEEPKNDFDRMLNKWYELFDVHTSTVPHPAGGEAKHRLVFETWIPASEAFIASYSPDLQEQLQQWRDRKQEPLGIDAILEARRPNAEYGLDDEGNAEMPDNEQLFDAVMRVVAYELGWTKEDFIALRESE